MTKIIGDEFPEYIAYQQQVIFNILEDIYSVSGQTEIQEAIDTIGTGSGTIFIESGTHQITEAINLNTGGSLIIYGHGGKTILKPSTDINTFNITNMDSVTIEKLNIDASNMVTNVKGIIDVNEIGDNRVIIQNIKIFGDSDKKGVGVYAKSSFIEIKGCIFEYLHAGVYSEGENDLIITNNHCENMGNSGIQILNPTTKSILSNNSCISTGTFGIVISGGQHNIVEGNIVESCQRGILITGATSLYNIISNNQSISCSQAGIRIQNGADRNILIGNSLISNGTWGIQIDGGCDYNIIVTNHYYNNGSGDVLDSGPGTLVRWTGWFDDGANFRITVVDGIITAVANSTAGGHNP